MCPSAYLNWSPRSVTRVKSYFSRQRMLELMAAANVIVLVSHDLAFVRETCTKVLWLHEGQTAAFGDPASVVARYQTHAADAPPRLRSVAS